jgi:hypothetical protein
MHLTGIHPFLVIFLRPTAAESGSGQHLCDGEELQWLDDRGITPYIRVKESPMPESILIT